MTPIGIGDSVDCGTFRQFVYHFQADELAEADRGRLQEHLDACERCARYLAFEDSFASVLRRRLTREAAPSGLAERIREGLTREDPAAGRRILSWLRSPAAAVSAAGVLLALLLIPSLMKRPAGPVGAVVGPVPVLRTVTLVDRECDSAGRTIQEQIACRQAHHLNALRLPDGTYWHLSLDDPVARGLLFDTALRGRRMVVEGDLYPEIRTVHNLRIRDRLPDRL